MSNIMRVINTLNAMLLGATGVLTFILLSPPTLPEILSSLYIIAFSLLLVCFEFHLKRFDQCVLTNFGFMFKWQGRLLFFLFMGTLCFGLGTMGIVTGSITLTVVIFNIYVICTNDNYKKYTVTESKELTNRAGPSITTSTNNSNKSSSVANPYGAAANPYAASGMASSNLGTVASPNDSLNPFTVDVNVGIAGKSVPVSVSVTDVVSAASTVAAAIPAGWEKILDPGTGKYYFYNSKTQESRWDLLWQQDNPMLPILGGAIEL